MALPWYRVHTVDIRDPFCIDCSTTFLALGAS